MNARKWEVGAADATNEIISAVNLKKQITHELEF